MDRIIKFRGKIKDKKRAKELNLKVGDWVYGYYFYDEGLELVNGKSKEFGRHYIINTPCFEEFIEIIPETLGQFIKQYDKNGEEIYEDDIVYVISEDENAFILWDNETSRYILQFKDWCADFDNYYGKELEIIGNIYNNKNLLEEE